MSRATNQILVLVILCYGLYACSPDNDLDGGNTQNSKTTKHHHELITLSPPNPNTMDPKVAAVVSASWDELQTLLANHEQNPIATAEAYADYGLSTFGNGLTVAAEAAFTNASILAPKDARWIYFLALMHQYNGKLGAAVESFKKVLSLSPDDQPTRIRLANVYFEQGEMDLAAKLYQEVISHNIDSAAAYYGLGRIRGSNEEHKQAIAYFEKAKQLQPQADRINYFLGMAWRNLGEKEKAMQFLSSHGPVEPNFEDALFDEISGGESRIDGLWAHMNAGSQAFVDGQYETAVKEFRLATADLPNDSRSWQSLGMALNKNGEKIDAINSYTKALELDKDNAVIHHELAKLKADSSKLIEAEEHLREAIRIDPKMIEAHRSYAQLSFRQGKFEDALDQYQDAISLDQQSSELAIAKAETLVAMGRGEDAENTLRESIGINPSNSQLRMAYGLILAERDKLELASSELDRALNDAEDNLTKSRAHYAIGQLSLKSGAADEALRSFGSALKLNSKNRAAGLALARTFIRLRDMSQALGTYDVYLKNWPNDDGARVEAARVAVMLGDGAKAYSILIESAELSSASGRLLGTLARLLVLSTDPNIKDPDSALKYALRAIDQSPATQHQETLALCYSAAGMYEKAVALQEELISKAGIETPARARARMEKNLSRYRLKQMGRLPFDAS